jgi:SAM-dependent methyltransferase
MFEADPTKRFSKTVENYLAYRPGYPPQIIDFLKEKFDFAAGHVVADVGSGTGKLTSLFLENGNPVFTIEPNPDMRLAAEQLFRDHSNFHSINGTAEETNLSDKFVDFIVAAQAFHWFHPQKAKAEFQRILTENGKILLIWNNRIDEESAFMKAYDDFLKRWATDYEATNLRKVDHDILSDFFAPKNYFRKDFYHYQQFDLEGLIGRYLSCSYAFDAQHPEHEAAISVLKRIFERFQENGFVKMWYRAEVYFPD